MPEIIIKYKDSKTLELLKSLSSYFDFIISAPKTKASKEETISVNGVLMVRRSSTAIDNDVMNDVVTRNKLDAKELRSKWQRGK